MAEPSQPKKDPARWERRYVARDLPWDLSDVDSHLVRFLSRFDVPACRVLDIGCGTGSNALWLDTQGYEVLGIDLSPTAVKIAQERATEAALSCRFQAADFLADPVSGGPFGLVTDRGCFHIFDDVAERERFVAHVASLLSPGGLWYSLLGSTDGPPRDTGPPRRSAREIMDAVEPAFEIVTLEATDFDPLRHGHAKAWNLVARRREA